MALPFKTTGKLSKGCNYVLVSWATGKPQRRRVVSCHRSAKAARKALRKMAAKKAKRSMSNLPGLAWFTNGRSYAVYNVRKGTRLD